MSVIEILQFVNDVGCYPNILVACRISTERRFSKFKLLKNSMLQYRLNGLTTCCIEKDILDKIELDIVLNDFASRNARKDFFVKH
jgi:hypothetical protein